MNLNTRLTVKFLLQVFLLFVTVCIIGVGTIIYLSRLSSAPQVYKANPVSLLKQLHDATTYHKGVVSVAPQVIDTISRGNGWLQILNTEGQEVYQYRRPPGAPRQYPPGLFMYDKENPDKFGYQLFTWYDTEDGQSLTWLYALPFTETQPRRTFTHLFLVVTCGGLVATTVVALLFGRRLGAPLLHMMNWLRGLGNGTYTEPADHKGIPRSRQPKSHRLRRSYRLYREVIAALEHLTGVLRQNENERQRLEQSREQWIEGVSHDLKTPLSSIKGYGTLLATQVYDWSEDDVRKFGSVISDKAAYMEGLIEDLSLTFRLRNKALPLRPEPHDVVELARRAVIDLINNPKTAGQSILFDNSGELSIMYRTDAKWFKRALDNLLANASTHNPPGTNITVRLAASPVSGTRYPGVLIQIADDGTGMDEETVANLFNRYFRGTNTEDERANGSGLGTAIAKQIVEAHGGSITVYSAPGRGSTFYISLPSQN